jgi:hypothetical protein
LSRRRTCGQLSVIFAWISFFLASSLAFSLSSAAFALSIAFVATWNASFSLALICLMRFATSMQILQPMLKLKSVSSVPYVLFM